MKFGESLEEFKENLKLRDDEYLKNGLPYCKNCNKERFFSFEEGKIYMRGSCKCEQEKRKKEEEEEKRRKRIDEFNNRQKLSLIGERYKNIRLKNAVITENNRLAYEKFNNYIKHSEECFNQNIGLYVYGDNSSGKTHLTACLCNELVWVGYRCVYTNLASILNEIRSSYDGNGMGECEVLSRLQYYDFAFIDDFGKEFIGREFNSASSKWSEEKLFEILNARYNAQKPTIFSSNYSIGELSSILNLDKAIVERVNEMATRIIKLEGDDFRESARKEKSDTAKAMGI